MKSTVLRVVLGITLASGLCVSSVCAAEDTAKESVKTLPTLLIKGEVVSLDTTDPAGALLKVKDRYGFETPIYLPAETKITQGDKTVTAANLSTGSSVEVEYNFDINTAKRHAVSVKVATPTAAVAAPATPTVSAPAAPVTPMTPVVTPATSSETPASAAPAMAAPVAAPATPTPVAVPQGASAPQQKAPAAKAQ